MHTRQIVGGEPDLGEPVFQRVLSRCSFQQQPLIRWCHEIAWRGTRGLRTAAREPKNIGIELARFIHVINVDRDVIDAENARALDLLAVARGGLQNHATKEKSGGACYSSGESERVRHDCAIINPLVHKGVHYKAAMR